jgi:hypothetical protein
MFAGIYIFIIIINLYIGLHACLFLRALAWKLGLKLPYWAAWLLFLVAALVYLLIRSRGGFVQSAFRIFNDYWGAMLATPLLLL